MTSKFTPVLLLIVCALAVYGQPSGMVRGVITDESGALVPGAKITVSNPAGPVKTGTAGDDGAYSVTGLAPGQYSVVAASPGLVQPQPASVNIPSGPQAVTLNLQLNVAAEKQEVTVQENAGPMVSVDPSQNAGALILRGADLDALSDDPDDLQADLQALAGPAAGPSGGQIYIDGFTGGTLPAKDSIREIRINQNPFSPNSTSWAMDASKSSPSRAPTSFMATSTSRKAVISSIHEILMLPRRRPYRSSSSGAP